MKTIRMLIAVLLLAFSAIGVQADLPSKKVLTLDVAKKFAAAAETEAKKRGSTVVIVVVDDGGYPLVLLRLDDTQVASVEVGIGKARTAAIFRRPSKVFEEQVKNGRVAALALEDHKATPHLKASFAIRQQQGWMTEITTWNRVREDFQPAEQAKKE